jgi:hypothetical protein
VVVVVMVVNPESERGDATSSMKDSPPSFGDSTSSIRWIPPLTAATATLDDDDDDDLV